MRSRMATATRPPLALALAAIALASGCGGSSTQGNGVAAKSPNEIVAGAKTLADAAKSVHVSGTLKSAGTPITINMTLLAGKGGSGQLSQNGLSFQLIQIHGTVYIKGSAAFYQHIAGAAAAQLLQGRWLKAPASSGGLAALASLTDLHTLLDTTLASHGTLRKGAITSVNGQKAIAVSDSSTGGTLYVATTGPPYPVKVSIGGSSSGAVTFSQWNEPVTVIAPANAIDVTQLQARH
jgi:hypothetical protein